jgi:TRAP-type C4-dicarboxylate transport system permease small subunit
MGSILTSLDRIYHGVVRLFAWLSCALILIMTLLITYSVVVRFFLNSPIAWITEMTEYFLMYITFLAAPWLLQQQGHVRLDLVLNALKAKNKRLMEILSNLLGVIISVLITWYGLLTVMDLYQRGITVINILKVQKYILIMIIPISGILLITQFLKFTYSHLTEKKDGEQTGPASL